MIPFLIKEISNRIVWNNGIVAQILHWQVFASTTKLNYIAIKTMTRARESYLAKFE